MALRRRFGWYEKVRARICQTFPGYRFADVDALGFDDLLEHTRAIEYLAEADKPRP